MKKLFLSVLLYMTVFGAQAQDYIKEGYEYFVIGKYAEAKHKYEQYDLDDESSDHALLRVDQCDRCMRILPVADSLYLRGDLENARKEYDKILSINPFDPYVNEKMYYDPALDVKAARIGGVLLNGVIWSKYNVDKPGTFTDRPHKAGMFFQWNRRKGWSAKEREISDWDGSVPSGRIWEAANDPCPEGWRVPTGNELLRLVYAGYQESTLNGIDGCRFGNGDNSIFLPCAGQRDVGILFHSKFVGYYWSSGAMGLHFYYDGGIGWGSEDRTCGFSVRCVAK